MSYILSTNRNTDDIAQFVKNWEDYKSHLLALGDRFPPSAYALACSDWWYSFTSPEAPHDSRLLGFGLGDHGAGTYEDMMGTWIEIKLQAAHGGNILIRYQNVHHYALQSNRSSRGLHGDWRYDEFTLTTDGRVKHTIEWAEGAVWIIEAEDVEHFFTPESSAPREKG
ncbi:MAG: hypothetical protein JWL81_380 [Verrucomicrobiales bacterium]|nr:hypothetical protein [Verrucomicrobiales bacterium]